MRYGSLVTSVLQRCFHLGGYLRSCSGIDKYSSCSYAIAWGLRGHGHDVVLVCEAELHVLAADCLLASASVLLHSMHLEVETRIRGSMLASILSGQRPL